MKDLVFCSVAFGDQRYIQQQIKLRHSIQAIYPKANLQFYTNGLPPNAKEMADSLYGFKVHVVAEARKSFDKVIWLDPAMLLVDKIDRLMNFKMIACKDDSRLSETISEKFLNHLGITREWVHEKGWNLVGGSFYYFDFSDLITRLVFDRWMEYEQGGWFGTQREQASEQINSHRNDESCMSIALHLNGLKPCLHDEVGYCVSENPIFRKEHFK